MKKNNKKGFTLVELVIVVAVMAILVAVAIPTVASVTKSAQKSVDDSNAKTLESIIKLAEANAVAKDGSTATLDASGIANEIVKAKLGISKGTFKYEVSTGTVTANASAEDAKDGVYVISFKAATDTTKPATVTVTNGTDKAENVELKVVESSK